MPGKVRVGYRDYTLEMWPAKEASSSDRWGECDRFNGVIRIRDDLDPVEMANTVWHEVLHAAYYVGCCDSADEEKLVSILCNMQVQVWRDNPALIQWINEALAQGEQA